MICKEVNSTNNLTSIRCFDAQTIETIKAYKAHLISHLQQLLTQNLVHDSLITQFESLNLLHCCIEVSQLYDKNIYLPELIESLCEMETNIQHEIMQTHKNCYSAYDAFEIVLQNLWSWTNAKIECHQKLADFIHRIAEDVWNHKYATMPILEPYHNQYGIIVCDNRIFINYFSKHTTVFTWPNIDNYQVSKVEDSFDGMTLKFENSKRNATYKTSTNSPFDIRTDEWSVVAKSYVLCERLFNNPSWQQILRQWRVDTYKLNALRSKTYMVFRSYLRTFSRICCEKTLNGITYAIDHDVTAMQPTVTEQLFTVDKQLKFDNWHINIKSDTTNEHVSYLDLLACMLFKCEYTTCKPNSMIVVAPKFN